MANVMGQDAEWQRLYERYHAMGDGELLGLAGEIDDLTEVAGDVLRRELKSRGLSVVSEPSAELMNDGGSDGEELVALKTFYDALEARRACEFLEAAGIEFALQDVSQPDSGLRSLEGGPPVALQLMLDEADRARAMTLLRAKMGLFPLQEVSEEDEMVDDGTIATLGSFAERPEAEEIALILENAGIWHRVVVNPEGTAEDEDKYIVEVREIDLFLAGDAVADVIE